MIKELLTTAYAVETVHLAARDHLCINDEVLKTEGGVKRKGLELKRACKQSYKPLDAAIPQNPKTP